MSRKKTTVTDSPTLFAVDNTTVADDQAKVSADQVREIFDLWMQVHGKSRAVLTDDRARKIKTALANYGREMCISAIHGCSLSPWHMGKNPNGRTYNDIELILRNASKVEGFAELWVQSRSGGGFLD